MKRYKVYMEEDPNDNLWKALKEDENGDYVKYEDVTKLIRSILNVFSGTSNKISDEEIEAYISDDILEGMLKYRSEIFLGG